MSSSQEILVPAASERKQQQSDAAVSPEYQELYYKGLRPDPEYVEYFRRWGCVSSAISVVIALVALVGWLLNNEMLKAWLPGQISMKPNTLFTTITAGLALLLITLPGAVSGWRRALAGLLAIFTALVNAITAIEYLVAPSFQGFDNLIFREAPGAPHTTYPARTAPNTSGCLLLIGIAILLLLSKKPRLRWLAQAVAGITASVAVLALLGYMFSIETLYGLGLHMYMSLPVASAILALSLAIAWATAEHGLLGQMTTRGGGSLMLRRILPLAIVLTWFVCFLSAQGTHRGWYSGDMDDLLITASLIVILSGLLYANARELNRLDAEREATHEIFRRSSEQWKLTFDCMSEGLSYHDLDFNVVATNAAFRNLVGCEVDGHKCFEAVHGCGSPHDGCPMVRTIATGNTEESEIYEPRIGKHLLVRTDPVRDSSGNIFRIVHVVEDITVRKKAEENIRRLASIVEQSEDAIFSTDIRGRVLSWNRAAERIYGYAADEIIGRSVTTLAPPESLSDSASIIERISQGRRMEGEERIRIRKDGTRFFALLTISPMRDDQGAIVGASAIVRDITEKKRVEQEVQRTRAELNTVVDSMGEGLYQLDTDGRLVFMNAACERMLGYKMDELLGRKMHDVMHSRLPDGTLRNSEDCSLLGVLRHGEPVHSDEDWFIRKDGTFVPVEYTSSPLIVDGKLAGAVLSFRDITERRRAEEGQRRLHELERRARRELEAKNVEIEKLNAELETRVRHRTAELEVANRELEAFSYSVSHDLRAPLRSLDGFSHILLDEYRDKLDGEGRDFLQRLRAASQHMGQLIDALLQLSRVSRSDMTREPVDLSTIASQIASDLQRSSPERNSTFKITPGLQVTGDPRLMHAALQNLLGNAWKFTAKRAETEIEFGAMQQDGMRVFYVRDNGAGFDMNYSNKLFGAFQRLHTAREFEGSGIGLATVQRIVHRHGGKVWAEGRPNEGATFFFTIE
jgi:PAS domain S-box-containing protein